MPESIHVFMLLSGKYNKIYYEYIHNIYGIPMSGWEYK